MIDPAQKAPYSIDTNVLMDWQARFFPTDVFVSLPGKINELIQDGRLLAPTLVEEELGAVGTADLSK